MNDSYKAHQRFLFPKKITTICSVFPIISSHAITQDVNIVQTAKAAEFFLSDGVILTGSETGDPTSVQDLKDVQKAVGVPVLIGSGVTDANIKDYAKSDAVIVGSFFKHNGHWTGNLDSNKVSRFMEKVHLLR